MKSLIRSSFALWILATAVPAIARENRLPLLHPLFSDHSVIQRNRPVPVWGWAEPGSRIIVRFAGQSVEATTGPDGRWQGNLEPIEASAQGRPFTVENRATGTTTAARDVVVGDVWLCSGQSNMEMGITLCHEDQEIAAADTPWLRFLTVPQIPAYAPEPALTADWKVCSPAALREGSWGGFSATAYFFGNSLQRELGIPIGLIHASWGGTVAEAWISGPGLTGFPAFQSGLAEVSALAKSTAENPELAYLDAWFEKHDPGTRHGWHLPGADTSSWQPITVPGTWEDFGIPGFEGVVWARREIDLPEAWAKLPLVVKPGEIADNDTCWLNGTRIGGTNRFGIPRTYHAPAGTTKAGRNVLTLRITNCGGGSITQEQQAMAIHPEGKPEVAISLAGPWQLRETAKMADTGRPLIGNPNAPSILFNGMIAPLGPFTLTGVIWYQGEANTDRPAEYRKLLPTLVQDWRHQFRRQDLAFHIVSLANYQKQHGQPRDSNWAELREAQAMTARSLPHCGLAVTIDIGDADDIHPTNKREVGRRLALSALATTYGKKITGSGPWFRTATIEGAQIRLHFDHTDGGLAFRGDSSRSFSIAGSDRKFVWATARIDGDTILLSSPEVPIPVAVRYAWDDTPQAVLYNQPLGAPMSPSAPQAGLPAVPFRTDDGPGSSGENP